jgi:hypothetical protein
MLVVMSWKAIKLNGSKKKKRPFKLFKYRPPRTINYTNDLKKIKGAKYL